MQRFCLCCGFLLKAIVIVCWSRVCLLFSAADSRGIFLHVHHLGGKYENSI
jgi:hypothetical protein